MAGNSRNVIGHVIPSLIFKALEGVVPAKVIGDSGGAPIWAMNCVGQNDDGTQYSARCRTFTEARGRGPGSTDSIR